MRTKALYGIALLGMLGGSAALVGGGSIRCSSRNSDFGPVPGLPQWHCDAFG